MIVFLFLLFWFGLAGAATPDAPYAKTGIKADFGHYFATRYIDTPADGAMLCAKPNVKGINRRQTWAELEPSQGVYNWSDFDAFINAVPSTCRVWLFIEWKSFPDSPVKNPCPIYLRQYSALVSTTSFGCFMWEPAVLTAFKTLLTAAATRFDSNPKVEGVILQESSTGFTGIYSQDVGNGKGGTYTPEKYRDALIDISRSCNSAFKTSRCIQFLNFIRGNNGYLKDVALAIDAIPNRQGCVGGPDILPNNDSLTSWVYPVIRAHKGCRVNSAQNDSYEDPNCKLGCIMDYALSGICVNSYLFWNHRTTMSPTGLDWTDALPVIAANPFSRKWAACGGPP